MRNFLKKTLAIVTALLVLGATPSAPVEAQGANILGVQVIPFKAKYVANTLVAADSDPAIIVKFFGPGGQTGTTTLAVAAAGDLTFVVNGAAYTGFECPVSGALGGVIDVSDAACDTYGEVIDIINATATSFSTGYFRAVIANGLRSDSSNDTLKDIAASTNVGRPQGMTLTYESATGDDATIALWDQTLGIQNWIPKEGKKLVANPFTDTDWVLQYASIQVTNAGTIGNYEVHCTVENYLDGKAASTETDTIIYLETGAATTVVGKIDEFLNAGGLHCQGGKLWIRALASGADTSAFSLLATGYRTYINP